jgi:hypothetical protein
VEAGLCCIWRRQGRMGEEGGCLEDVGEDVNGLGDVILEDLHGRQASEIALQNLLTLHTTWEAALRGIEGGHLGVVHGLLTGGVGVKVTPNVLNLLLELALAALGSALQSTITL